MKGWTGCSVCPLNYLSVLDEEQRLFHHQKLPAWSVLGRQGTGKKRSAREEAGVVRSDKAMDQRGLLETTQLSLMIPIKNGDSHKALDLMIYAKR